MRIVLLFIISFFFLNSVAKAAEFKISSKDIYDATYDVCSKISESKLKADFDKYYAGYFPSEKFMAMLKTILSDSYDEASEAYSNYSKESTPLVLILDNEGFKNALHDCYGDSEYPIQFFYRVVNRTDRKGKIIAGVKDVASLMLFGKIFAKLYQISKIGTLTVSMGLIAHQLREIIQNATEGPREKNQISQKVKKMNSSSNAELKEQISKRDIESRNGVKDLFSSDLLKLNNELDRSKDPIQRKAIQDKISKYKIMIKEFESN
jgi:hypothetical protein